MPDRNLELALKIKADIQQAKQALSSVEAELRKVSAAGTAAGAGARAAGAGMGTVDEGARKAESGARSLITQLKTLPGLTAKISFGFHDLRNILVTAFAVHELVAFTGELVNANVEAQRIEYTFKQAFGPAAAEQIQFIRQESDRLGLSFKDAADSYGNIAASAQDTGLKVADLQKLFVGLSEAATVLHTPAAQLSATMIQLSQGISLGTLQMQDIRAIAQHLPGTFTILTEAAKRLGTTLSYALQHGGLDAKKFLGEIGEVAHERFGVQAVEASHSLNAELNRLKTTLFEASTEGTGFADDFAEAIRNLNTTLADPTLHANLKTLIGDIGKVASAVITATAKIAEFANELGTGLGVAIARFERGGLDPGDALGNTKKNLADVNTELERLRDFGKTDHGVNVGPSEDVIRRILGIDYTTQITPKMIRDAIAAREAMQQTYKQAIAIAEKGGGGPIVPSKGGGKATTGTLGSGGPPPADPEAAKRAAKLAKEAAKAQGDLTQSLISLQAQLSPTAAIYAKYNDAVAKATAEAELAKKAHGANAQAIDAQKQAVIDLAAKVRDAALDQLVEKDRQAWEALKRSFETPAEVRVDDAIKQIAELNRLMKEGGRSAAEYHAMLAQIGQHAVAGALPTYGGVDAAVAGPYGELQKNYQAQTALDTAYRAQKLALDKQFNDQDAAQHAAHVAALAALDEDYKNKSTNIERARGNLQLTAASNLFGQLATLSTSHNKKMAAVGKAAAIAQAIIETYKSANEAYSAMALIPYIGPELGIAAAAAAVAAGLANVAQIRSQPTGGYQAGGWTGDAPVTKVVGVVHGREGVLSAPEVEAIGGEAGFNRLRQAIRGYAIGGYVSPYASAPSPADLGFSSPSMPRVRLSDFAAPAAAGGRGDAPQTHIHVWNTEQAANELAQVPSFHKAVVHIVGDNPNAIKGRWNR